MFKKKDRDESDSQLVTAARIYTKEDEIVLQSMLDSTGISCLFDHRYFTQRRNYPLFSQDKPYISLIIRKEDLAEVSEIVADYARNKTASGSETSPVLVQL